jgi:CubicO group peptidase (beta-lactamase class C family)
MPISSEYFVDPLAPSGGLWSNVLDMGAYMAAWMNGGEALVSAEQRDLMWTPQVPISAQASYGLGWILSQYKNQRMIGHGGNTIGFTSTFEFLPEARLGVIVLANGRGANALTDVVAARVFELAFNLESELLDSFDNTVKQAEEILANFNGTTAIDAEAVADYLGTWSNDFLGEVTFSLDDDGLLMGDVGEFRSVMMVATDATSGITSYIFRDPPVAGAGFTFERNEDGKPVIYIDKGSAQEYVFSKQD